MAMDDSKTQKERLEQEHRFLRESFEAEVISREEYERGRDRIEKKLKEIKESEKGQIDEVNAKAQEKADDIVMEKDEKPSELKTDEKIKLKVIQDEHFEPVQIKVDATEKTEESAFKPGKEIKEEKKGSNFFKYAFVFIVLVLVLYFSYSFLKENKAQGKKNEEKPFAVPIEAKLNVVVLNDEKNCFNCNTQRVLSILESWFGALGVKEIDYSSEQGRKLAEKFDVKLLPTYILDENVTKKPEFEKFKRAFVKKENSYVLNYGAAGSALYIRRDNVPNKLDLFVIPEDESSIKAEKNLKEFLDAFKEVKFDKHSSSGKLTEELGIKTFPTFLVNNRVKFSGVHTSETIKGNFCRLNKLPACGKSLSKNLI